MKDTTLLQTKRTGCLLALFCLVFFSAAAQARDVTFSWTSNPEQVDSYQLYYKAGASGGEPYNGTGATEGASPVNTGNGTTFTLHGLSDTETYFFVLTAKTGTLESTYSSELVLDPLPDYSDPGPGITVTFSWLPNTETDLAGYTIQYGTTSGSYSTTVDVGQPTPIAGRIQAEVTGLNEGVTYYFVATAYDSAHVESDYSTEVVWTAPSQSGGAPPIASDSSISTSEDQAVSSTVTASNNTGLPISYAIQQNVIHGVVLLEAGNGAFTYTPDQNFSGADSFTFLASDDNGDSIPATVNITITTANDAPVAQTVSIGTDEDTSINGQLQAQDPDNNLLTYSKATDPAHGTVTVNSNGAFTYTPNADFSGADNFSFTVNDGQITSPPATVSITIAAINDPPTAIDATLAGSEDTLLNGQLQADDPDEDTLTFTTISAPVQGTLTVNAAGTFSYTPDTNATGEDSFTFQVSDGQETSNIATVAISISAVNDPPTVDNVTLTINEDTPMNGQLQGQDPESDNLTYTVASTPSRGTLVMNPSGSFTYTPDTNVSGTDSFSYQANDGQATSNPGTVSITIAAINDPPVADDLALTATEGTPVNGQLQAQDPDSGDSMLYTVATQPAYGTLTLATSGSFTYTANSGVAASDNFTFKVSDGQAASSIGTVSITIEQPIGVIAHFSWLPNAETTLAGYKIHYGTTTAEYDTILDIGNPAPIDGRVLAQVENLISGVTYFFATTAYDSNGVESKFSSEIRWTATTEFQLTPSPTAAYGTITGIFGDTPDSNQLGTLSDTFISTDDTNYSTDDSIQMLSQSTATPHKPASTIIIKADLASLPQDVQITEATLYLYQTGTSGATVYENSIHQITGINPTIDQATGNNAFNGGPWTPVSAGMTADNVPLGLADIAQAEDTIILGAQPGYQTWKITEMVQNWVSTPSDNFGLLIAGAETATATGRTFASSNNGIASFRPKLIIYYIRKPPTPSVISAQPIP